MYQYFRNLFGAKLTDEELEDIPNPNFELGLHVTRKCFQASAVILTLYATASCTYRPYAGLTRMQSIAKRISGSGLKWGLIGCAIGPVMTAAKVKGSNLSEDGVRDRCYRLRKSRNQVRVDQGEDAGLLIGILCAVLMGQSWVLGAIVGPAVGVLDMAILNSTVFAKKPEKPQ